MTTTDWANLARCAEQRMDDLWQQCCSASATNGKWQPLHERRWREHLTYMAMQSQARRQWRLRPGP